MTDRDDSELLPASALSRRTFLGALGTGAAAVSLAACRAAPPEEIVPYVERPPEVVPGKSRMYATAAMRGGYAVGLLGESREGRPIKIEGNPNHPASLGAAGPWEQAATLSLYDDDRSGEVLHHGRPSSFREWAAEFGPDGDAPFARNRGEGLHLWLEPTSSLVVDQLLGRLRERYPAMQVWFDPSSAPLPRWEAARRVFGEPLETHYAFDRARRVLSLDADFLNGQPTSLAWARSFASTRDVESPSSEMSRLYVVEPRPSVTGTMADHRLPARASEIVQVARRMVAELARLGATLPAPFDAMARRWRDAGPHAGWLAAAARDLWEQRGGSVVVVGERQPAAVHVLGHLLNEMLGANGEIVSHGPTSILGASEGGFEAERLLDALDAGEVRTLVTLESNPAYTSPAVHRFGERATQADRHVHVAPYRDETSRVAEWFIGSRHFLESWGDGRAADGTLTPVQPLIRPLFGGRQVEQVLATLAGEPHASPRALLAEAWAARGHDLEAALARGLAAGSAHGATQPAADWARAAETVRAAEREEPPSEGPWEVVLEPDPRVLDGRYANNAWLQEMPEPITKLTWDNAALMSPESARRLGVEDGDVVQVKRGATAVALPAWPQKGMPDDTVVVWLGYGRRDGGRVGRSVGVDVSPLRPQTGWVLRGAYVKPIGGHVDLACTQRHQEMHDRPIVLHETLEEWRRHPDFAEPHDETPPSIYPTPEELPDDVPQWGMAIDLNRCTGCSACVVACQAENNIPAVGKGQVAMGREMHWMRIDLYYTGEGPEEHIDVQPMLCQHCEHAPCEYVCPVNATVHSPDGLNEMVYNRCVGTRFCSNNCPYKVRRFNWLDFNRSMPEPRQMAMNPDVTVRARGVMEKCTYCVQRIRRAEIEAMREGRRLRDADVVTACQQTCPTEAIVFGQVSDPESEVSEHHASKRAYGALNELGTRPRTRYLARISNPNPSVEEEA